MNRNAAFLALALAGCGGVETDDLGTTEEALAGTFSGVTFDEAAAVAVVDMLDKATLAELDAVPLVTRASAEAILAARPFLARATEQHPIARLDAISGVGPATLASVRDNVQRLWCALADGRQRCSSAPAPATPAVVINEFAPGTSGWVELFVTSGSPALDGWSIDDTGSGAPKTIAPGLVIRSGRVVIPYGAINVSSADGVVLRDETGRIVDQASNQYDGATLAGSCLARIPDGGAFSGQRERCTKEAPNSVAVPGPGPVVPPPSGPVACKGTGGTYDSVPFTRAQECRAVEFLNRARASQMASVSDRGRVVALECAPDGTTVKCTGYRSSRWTSLDAFSRAPNIAKTTMEQVKAASAAWRDDGGPLNDTVANHWANRTSLVNKPAVFERVYVTRVVANELFTGCVEFRDAPDAGNYLVACAVYVSSDSAPACSTPSCATQMAGRWMQIRGTFRADSRFGYKLNLKHDQPRPAPQP